MDSGPLGMQPNPKMASEQAETRQQKWDKPPTLTGGYPLPTAGSNPSLGDRGYGIQRVGQGPAVHIP